MRTAIDQYARATAVELLPLVGAMRTVRLRDFIEASAVLLPLVGAMTTEDAAKLRDRVISLLPLVGGCRLEASACSTVSGSRCYPS
ncbi:hypothetical protein PV318_00220 [Streptomyces sp. ME02-6991-2B]|nr:hypothetical protein [Streptomyces sp. ME02-6991-2B]